jgi:hypothetical protein
MPKNAAMKSGWAAYLTIGVCVGAVGAGTAIPIAMAQDDGHVFYACEKQNSIVPGTMHVDEAPTCSGGATLVTWSESGPVGPQGPPGPSGPAGASAASTATAGSDGWGQLFAQHEVRVDFASCPAGEVRFVVTVVAGQALLPTGPTACVPITQGSFNESAVVYVDPRPGTPSLDRLYSLSRPGPLSGQAPSVKRVTTPTRTVSLEIRCLIPPAYLNPPGLYACSYDARPAALTPAERQLLVDADPVFTLLVNEFGNTAN